ncbi:hypothetical protein M409DRAFT_60763 [Zasmidium cellare ATCC 36951]|uniref:Uncharacterized protein n=1 Tax=Zasmidium cellare ATCC 36951 TaxID=1080233 RepID=A0A6A6C154_ZASCE|nr:uncharacterized protein M409DRAFT_60763 [Zasmidium cellare ATCC 36951]KAF2159552.1 hypothetical protein M409DRAFT_60763 [Zasmidium cellare ATCC 36951]
MDKGKAAGKRVTRASTSSSSAERANGRYTKMRDESNRVDSIALDGEALQTFDNCAAVCDALVTPSFSLNAFFAFYDAFTAKHGTFPLGRVQQFFTDAHRQHLRNSYTIFLGPGADVPAVQAFLTPFMASGDANADDDSIPTPAPASGSTPSLRPRLGSWQVDMLDMLGLFRTDLKGDFARHLVAAAKAGWDADDYLRALVQAAHKRAEDTKKRSKSPHRNRPQRFKPADHAEAVAVLQAQGKRKSPTSHASSDRCALEEAASTGAQDSDDVIRVLLGTAPPTRPQDHRSPSPNPRVGRCEPTPPTSLLDIPSDPLVSKSRPRTYQADLSPTHQPNSAPAKRLRSSSPQPATGGSHSSGKRSKGKRPRRSVRFSPAESSSRDFDGSNTINAPTFDVSNTPAVLSTEADGNNEDIVRQNAVPLAWSLTTVSNDAASVPRKRSPARSNSAATLSRSSKPTSAGDDAAEALRVLRQPGRVVVVDGHYRPLMKRHPDEIPLVVLPMSDDTHWITATISPAHRTCIVADSLRTTSHSDFERRLQTFCKRLTVGDDLDWYVTWARDAAQQDDAASCGLYAVADAILRTTDVDRRELDVDILRHLFCTALPAMQTSTDNIDTSLEIASPPKWHLPEEILVGMNDLSNVDRLLDEIKKRKEQHFAAVDNYRSDIKRKKSTCAALQAAMEQNIQAGEAARQRLEETTPVRKQYLAVCEQIAQLPPFAVADEYQRRYAYEPQVRGIEQLSQLGREYRKGQRTQQPDGQGPRVRNR